VNVDQLRMLLAAVARGETPVEGALERLRGLPFEDLGFATVDHHRQLRCGHPEVIFCQGKTVGQVVEIARRLAAGGANVLATRASAEQIEALRAEFAGAVVSELGRAVWIENQKDETRNQNQVANQKGDGIVAVVCAGTSDLPVAEEAGMTLRAMGAPFVRINDVGVSGLHRLLPHVPVLQRACAVVVIAGMEGALPSVVGGLVACPVYAVPTSVGYGSSMGGLVAMLAMLNSCASNISVVNIDNGFGAAYSAGLVWKGRQKREARSE
jgi:pyridinium-3,5-biscarboxylic acid mononucleotide synthase